ncbi:hypothetical protein ACJX0J_027518, partial [Zea mays]
SNRLSWSRFGAYLWQIYEQVNANNWSIWTDSAAVSNPCSSEPLPLPNYLVCSKALRGNSIVIIFYQEEYESLLVNVTFRVPHLVTKSESLKGKKFKGLPSLI